MFSCITTYLWCILDLVVRHRSLSRNKKSFLQAASGWTIQLVIKGESRCLKATSCHTQGKKHPKTSCGMVNNKAFHPWHTNRVAKCIWIILNRVSKELPRDGLTWIGIWAIWGSIAPWAAAPCTHCQVPPKIATVSPGLRVYTAQEEAKDSEDLSFWTTMASQHLIQISWCRMASWVKSTQKAWNNLLKIYIKRPAWTKKVDFSNQKNDYTQNKQNHNQKHIHTI